MKMIRQIILFLLGTAAGVGLFALVVNLGRRTDSPRKVADNLPAQAVTVPQVQKTPHRSRTHHRARYPKHRHGMHVDMAEVRMPARPRRHRSGRHVSSSSRSIELAANSNAQASRDSMQSPVLAQGALVPHAEPAPTFFKSIGYVEKADGQLEAIIMQDDAVQVVRIGDRIADRYKVTSITPEVVGAIEEPAVVAQLEPGGSLPHATPEAAVSEARVAEQTPRPTPVAVAAEVPTTDNSSHTNTVTTAEAEVSSPGSYDEVSYKSMGYVEKYDGKVEAVEADGDSVRLVATRQAKFVTKFAAPVDHPNAIQSAQAAPAPDKKSTVALASPVVHKPAIQSSLPPQAALVRQVIYEESYPADDEAVPVQPVVSRSREQNP